MLELSLWSAHNFLKRLELIALALRKLNTPTTSFITAERSTDKCCTARFSWCRSQWTTWTLGLIGLTSAVNLCRAPSIAGAPSVHKLTALLQCLVLDTGLLHLVYRFPAFLFKQPIGFLSSMKDLQCDF